MQARENALREQAFIEWSSVVCGCLLYTSDAADE